MFSNKHYTDAIKGVSWLFISTVASRFVVFAAQIFIGYLLSPKDIGLYAIALSVTNFLGAVRNGGTLQWLVYRGSQYKEYLSDTTQYALVFNFICMFLTLVAVLFIDHGVDSKTIQILCFVIAISIPISTFGAIYRIELLIQNRFKQSAVLSTVSTVMWQLEILYAAYNGYGPYSYIVPILLQAIFDGILGWYFVRSWPIKKPLLAVSKFTALLRETRLIMLAAFALSLALTGQYFVTSLFASAATVGLFFFGFQNAYNVFILINVATESVLPSIFTKIDTREKQNKTVIDLLETFGILASPLLTLLLLISPHLFFFVWQDKWMQSVFVFQCGLLSIPALLLISFIKSLHEARGQWKYRFVVMFVYGIGTVSVVGLASLGDHLRYIAISLTGFYFVLSLFLLRHLSSLLDTKTGHIYKIYFSPMLVSLLCSILYLFVYHSLNYSVFYKLLSSIFLFIIVQVFLNAVFYKYFWSKLILQIKKAK